MDHMSNLGRHGFLGLEDVERLYGREPEFQYATQS
jgi:hypothetical protein